MSIYIETQRLVLRQFTGTDAEGLNSICNQPFILRWMPDWRSSVEQRKEWLKWVESQYGKATKETAKIMLAVTLKTSAKVIGMIGIGNKEEVDNEIDGIFYFRRIL